MFRIPATAKGYRLVTQMRTMLNTDSYKMRTLFTGKRPKGTPQATTLKKNAESIRVYIDSILEDGTNPRINDIYENGITTGKAREQFANEELISELKHELDSKQNELKLEITGHTMMREERDELNKEVAELKTELTKRNSNYNAIYNSKVKEWNKRLSAKDDALKRLKILMRSSIGAIEEANERRLRCLKGWAKAENSLKTQISVALQDLEEFTEDSRLDYEQTTF